MITISNFIYHDNNMLPIRSIIVKCRLTDLMSEIDHYKIIDQSLIITQQLLFFKEDPDDTRFLFAAAFHSYELDN